MGTIWKPRVTMAAVIEKDARFLLVEEKTSRGLRLDLPTVNLQPRECPLMSCARAARDRAGCKFMPKALVGVYIARSRDDLDMTVLNFALAGAASSFDARRATGKNRRALWMSVEEVREWIEAYRSPTVLQALEDHLLGRRYRLDVIDFDARVELPTVL